VRTSGGDVVNAPFCIMATGCLTVCRIPDIKGLEQFKGECYHTGKWPRKGVDCSGKRVGVIGNGSSGVQTIPALAKQASHLYAFQRTPCYVVPAQNRPLSQEYINKVKNEYKEIRDKMKHACSGQLLFHKAFKKFTFEDTPADQQNSYEDRWEAGGLGFNFVYKDFLLNLNANDVAANFVRTKIRSIVKDPSLADSLSPSYPMGAKRTCVDNDYYDTFNRDNVTLVGVKENPIVEITASGLRLENGMEYELDVLVLATGFNSMTGALNAIDIRGKNGDELRKKWDAGPSAYLGLMSSGFPNMFMITGPGSPSVLCNMVVSIEQHVEWIADVIGYMKTNNKKTIDAELEAEKEWVDHVIFLANQTLFVKANSWFLGPDVPGKSRIFIPYSGGMDPYRSKCEKVVEEGYKGFSFT